MLTLKNTSVMNFENAIRGARNPLNSWGRMDSHTEPDGSFVFGPNDLDLAMRLAKAGSDHRKYLRMIFVSVDVTAPLYWWKEYDTYKVATVANTKKFMETVVAELENIRLRFKETKSKEDWYDMIQLLPSSYNQMRTCTFNYETLINIYRARKNHKLAEWHTFCDWIETLPYAEQLITFEP